MHTKTRGKKFDKVSHTTTLNCIFIGRWGENSISSIVYYRSKLITKTFTLNEIK